METMMSSSAISLARPAILFVLPILAALRAGPALADVIRVQDPRPVAKAVEVLENKTGWRITYEDPPYVYAHDLVDVSGEIRRSATIRPGGIRTLIPKGGEFTFNFTSVGKVQSAVAEFPTVENLVASYNTSRNANLFAAVSGNKFVHVVPRQVAGESGKLETVTPILDTPIAAKATARPVIEILQQICTAISDKTGTRVVAGTMPLNMMINTTASIDASGERARSVLTRLLSSIDAALSWQLFYDPGQKIYVLNLHLVRSP